MMKYIGIIALLFLYINTCNVQKKVGDPKVRFNEKLIEANSEKWPQMKIWKTAGVRGGIPLVNKLKVDYVVESGADSKQLNQAINEMAQKGGGVILLKNGNYNIDKQVKSK